MTRATTDLCLWIVRRFAASREALFSTLTERGPLTRWLAPADESGAVAERFEARAGGSYRIEMRRRAGGLDMTIPRRGSRMKQILTRREAYTGNLERPPFDTFSHQSFAAIRPYRCAIYP